MLQVMFFHRQCRWVKNAVSSSWSQYRWQDEPVFYAHFKKKQTVAYNSGVVRELKYFDIITRTSNMSHCWHFFPNNIQPWTRAYLSKHPELLNVTEDEEGILKLEMENEGWNW
ncbi:super-infection exclusion protein B [Paenibacillus pabuli]|uniref:super-infection exclusion protein B n=1 Tax=Paenibacillus pabuli TaxID=1472 RepID=UPI003458EB67